MTTELPNKFDGIQLENRMEGIISGGKISYNIFCEKVTDIDQSINTSNSVL